VQAELRQLEEDDIIEDHAVFVPERAPTPAMSLIDVAVARDRPAVLLNNDNPFYTSHSTGESLSYPTPPEANADVDD
jgi:hypothetical protein